MILNRIINHGRTLPSAKACGSGGGGGGGGSPSLSKQLGLLSWTLLCNRFGFWKYSPVHERRLWILFHMQIHLTAYILLLELPKTCPSLPYVSLSINISPAANGGFAVFTL